MYLACICSVYDFFSIGVNWKDYIIPFISPIIGVGGAFWVLKKQLDTDRNNEKKKRSNLLESYLNLIKSLIPEINNSLKERIKTLEDASEKFILNENITLTRNIYEFESAQLIGNLPYIDTMEAVAKEDTHIRDTFSKFYFNVKALRVRNENYNQDVEANVALLNLDSEKYLNLSTQVFVEIQKILFLKENKDKAMHYRKNSRQKYFLSKEQAINHNFGNYISELEYFYYYIQSNNGSIFSQELGLKGLILVCRKKIFLEFIKIELAQNIHSLIALIDIKRSRLAVMQSTANNYITTFKKALAISEKLDNLVTKP